MKTFELDTSLKAERHDYTARQSARDISTRTFLFPRYPDVQAVKGFIDYACFCYQNHYGFVISPTDIMYMVQAELATAVKSNPDAFASMFTQTPGKKAEIVTLTGAVEEIDVDAVIDILRLVVPTNVDLFLPEFSTTDVPAKLATYVAFCDMVSPYYSYSTMLCGIPTVKIEGFVEDWQRLAKTLFDLSNLFTGDLKSYLARVWARVTGIIKEFTRGNGDLFRSMVSMKKCGSGSQYEITGWILDFMNKDGKRSTMEMLQNVHQHFSKMEYKNLETQRTFEMYTGIYYAELRDGVATPRYNACRIETTGQTKKETPSDETKMTIESTPIHSNARKLKGLWVMEDEQSLKIFKG